MDEGGRHAREKVTAGPFRVREIRYPAGLRQPPHAHEGGSVTLVLAGSIRERAGRREELAGPLSVVVKPPGTEHEDEIGPHGARTLQIAFDGAYARELAEGGADLGGWRWLHRSRAVRELLRMAWLGAMGAVREGREEREEREERIVDALGLLSDERAPSGPPDWLHRAREALDDRLSDGVTVEELARDADVHPVSLSRAFRSHYGISVTEYRRRERLRRAAGRIASGGRSLGMIAFESGYADQPHLCRDFRALAGLTPSEFRRLVR